MKANDSIRAISQSLSFMNLGDMATRLENDVENCRQNVPTNQLIANSFSIYTTEVKAERAGRCLKASRLYGRCSAITSRFQAGTCPRSQSMSLKASASSRNADHWSSRELLESAKAGLAGLSLQEPALNATEPTGQHSPQFLRI